ncbi:MAG: hypothetical protein PHQ43_09750 [Dehalococcoidales bacterium]|nr:hypothetical protein [Dehalococcoidales bacterium]
MSELGKRLHKVDPDLKIVPARPGVRMKKQDWLASTGVVCKECGQEVFRSRDGLCLSCWEKRNEIEIRDPQGLLTLIPQSVIMSIVKKPRGEK